MRTIAGAILLLAGAVLLGTGIVADQLAHSSQRGTVSGGAYIGAGFFGLIGFAYLLLGPMYDNRRGLP